MSMFNPPPTLEKVSKNFDSYLNRLKNEKNFPFTQLTGDNLVATRQTQLAQDNVVTNTQPTPNIIL
jgi:hypothetical protein